MRRVALWSLFVIVLAGCGKGQETQRVGREFLSMKDCLSFIENDLGDSLKVITDKPGDVSGKSVTHGLFFRCEAQATGTKGLVLQGRWDRLKN